MMKEINTKRIETAANLLIIVVALLMGVILIQKYFLGSPAASNQPLRLQPKVGEKINVSDVDWSNQPKTLLLVLQADCRFCNDSAPFYKQIIESVKSKNIRLVAVFPTDVAKSSDHLNKLGLTNMEVKQSSLGSLQVSGTPTLIITNDKGEITDYWVGKLPPDKETEVINKLNS